MMKKGFAQLVLGRLVRNGRDARGPNFILSYTIKNVVQTFCQQQARCLLYSSISLLILSATLFLHIPVSGQSPEKQREFVYGVNAFTGIEYQGVAYPRTVDTLYLLADTPNVISARESMVYFWPITNQYQVDWNDLNEIVEGDLEIVQGGEVIERISPTQYVIQYPDGLGTGEAHVYTGEEAELQYQEFERQRIAFRDRVFAYYEASRNYRQELEDKAKAGQLQGEPPPPPQEPSPFLFFSTGVYNGFPVDLPPGRYQIRVRGADGQIVPDSQRTLITFAPAREGVTYSIILHDKYTFPEESKDPSQILYAREGTIFYLQPSAEYEYNDFYLTHLTEPQSTQGNRDQWQWSPLFPIEEGTLELVVNGEVVERIERRHYVVRQITGSTLGYEIHDQQTTTEERLQERQPDFSGYAVHITSELPSFQLRLVDSEGHIILGSERAAHLVQTEAAGNFYALPLLPLGLGLGLAFWRRMRFTRVTHDKDEQ